MKNKYFFCILLISFSFTTIASQLRIVKVGAFNYYPAIFKDTDDSIKGFYVETLTEIGKLENIRFEYVYGSWSEGLDRIKNGEIDMMPSVAYLPERAEYMDYPQIPLLTVWGELYVLPGSPIQGIMDAHNLKIGIMKGDINAKHFIKMVQDFKLNCTFIEMPGFDNVFQAIKAKEVDAGVVNNTFGAAKFKEYGLLPTGIVFNPFDIFLTVKKGKNNDLLSLVDSYLKHWKTENNSIFNEARLRWSHGTVGQVEVFPQWLSYSLLILGFCIILAAIFILLLRNRVKRATQEILKKEEKFRHYINSSPDGIFVANEQGHYIDVNPAACTMTGYTSQELLQMSVIDFHTDTTYLKNNELFDILRNTTNLKTETTFKTKSGEIKWWALNTVLLNQTTCLTFAKDITDRKQNEFVLIEKTVEIEEQNEALLFAKEKAEESDKLKTAFLQNMSHEIRTPLNAIMGFSSILPSTLDSKPKVEEYCSIIQNKGIELVEIIDDILLYSNIELGHYKINNEDFTFDKIITNIQLKAEECSKRYNKQNITFNIVEHNTLQQNIIYADKKSINIIITHLISNAYKFTKNGSITVTFEYKNDNKIGIIINDTGMGIPRDKQDEIFKRFIKLENNEKFYEGTGLGLPIIKGILDLLKGTIQVSSESQKGSTFTVYLPINIKGKAAITGQENTQIQNKTTNDYCILIIEDDPYNRHFLTELLATYNYRSEQAATATEGIEKALNQSYDIVLMDIQLPDMTGYEATKIIKQRKPKLPIFAQTAFCSTNDIETSRNAGCNEHLNKPINAQLLITLIEKYLAIK